MSFFKKYHKWLGVILTIFIILFSLSGIVLNHREAFSFMDVDRKYLPKDFEYKNWNNAAVKSTLKINKDSVLTYGNIGIWLSNSSLNKFTDFNTGFPSGIDNRKVCKLLQTDKKELFAATFFGLYKYDFANKLWKIKELPVHEKRIVDLLYKQDTLFVLTRSHLLTTVDAINFETKILPEPENYDNKIGLFKTFWLIHSGEIYGEIGKLLVDLIGLIFIFLSITGLIFFVNGFRLKGRKKKKKRASSIKKANKWNLKWHNKIGWITLIFLVITTFTGMFLRPPLIALIGYSKVDKIPFTKLDSPNPWFDNLRRITYDQEKDRFIIATLEGFYYSDDNFNTKLKKYKTQPPASMMGVTVFKKMATNVYLVGSFEGLFAWNTETGEILDYIKKTPYIAPKKAGPPIGEFKVSGFTTDFFGEEIIFDYNFGAANINNSLQLTKMPKVIIEKSPLSLWNLALEIHTARFYKIFFGKYYILFIPLSGLGILFILISGFIVWYKLYRKNNKNNNIQIMETNKYLVTEECISCRACVEVADKNFEMNDSNVAFVKKQPKNAEEEKLCQDALNVCPVNAIVMQEQEVENDIEPVLAKSNIKQVLDRHPELKDVLTTLSPKLKKLQNPALYNTLARYASFKDAAKITGISICEILHTLNKFLGVENKLLKNMPECVQMNLEDEDISGVDISWDESAERYIYNHDSMPEIIQKVSALKAQENIVIISVENPVELLKLVSGLNFSFNIEKTREFRVSIFNNEKLKLVNWQERKEDFEILDVRAMTTDPFDIIIKKSYEIEEDSGFTLIQRFEPTPMINMLSEMGYEHVTEVRDDQEIWIYFHKKVTEGETDEEKSNKLDVVIQSATPVAYPVMMRLLQSEKIRKAVNIKELKVWEETEKHLAWIANGKADISFSALITSAKLRNSDVKIPALFVWDNFVILTRGYQARNLKDLIGKTIHTPLFEEAPPAKITKYLIKASGLNPADFNFVYGQPFGRPEKIYADFVTGQADTVILREPEASYAIKIMEDRGEPISILSYNKIWNEYNKGFGSFPNAGIVLKGEFVRNNPEVTEVLLEELKESINWVNTHRNESARLSYDMMRQPVDRVELFLDRVNFEYVEGDVLVKKVKDYFDILTEQGIVETEVDEEFLEIFKM